MKRKRLVNIIYWCCLKRHLDQDRMLLKSFPITGFIGLEKIFTFLMYFFITDSCMITTKSWKRPCEFTCIQAQETYFSKTPLSTYKQKTVLFSVWFTSPMNESSTLDEIKFCHLFWKSIWLTKLLYQNLTLTFSL